MDNDQLEAQSRAAIIARLNDPSVQLEYKFKTNDAWSACKDDIKRFLLDAFDYRIAKPRKWYRVAKMRDVLDTEPYTLQVTSEEDEEHLESDRAFVEWLDERKYYD